MDDLLTHLKQQADSICSKVEDISRENATMAKLITNIADGKCGIEEAKQWVATTKAAYELLAVFTEDNQNAADSAE